MSKEIKLVGESVEAEFQRKERELELHHAILDAFRSVSKEICALSELVEKIDSLLMADRYSFLMGQLKLLREIHQMQLAYMVCVDSQKIINGE